MPLGPGQSWCQKNCSDLWPGRWPLSVLAVQDRITDVKSTTENTSSSKLDLDNQTVSRFIAKLNCKQKKDIGENRGLWQSPPQLAVRWAYSFFQLLRPILSWVPWQRIWHLYLCHTLAAGSSLYWPCLWHLDLWRKPYAMPARLGTNPCGWFSVAPRFKVYGKWTEFIHRQPHLIGRTP